MFIKSSRMIPGLIPALLFLLAAHPVTAAEERGIKETAIEVRDTYESAIVEITAIVEIEISGGGRAAQRGGEHSVETMGTVIDESGLLVTAYSMINPVSMTPHIPMAQDGIQQRIQATGTVKDVKIRLPDGREINGRLVLKDPDLDLAFIMPLPEEEEGSAETGMVDLNNSVEPETLDQLIMLGRLPSFLNRQPSVILTRVTAVVERPRPFYAVAEMTGLGMPVFNADGRIVGITVIRKGGYTGDPSGSNMSAVILPAADVLEIARQALEEVDQ